jgi:hypothetical protein
MRRMIGVITVLMMSQAAATAEPQQIDLDVPSTTVAATVQINDVRFGGLCGLRSDIAPSPRSADFVAEVADERRKLRRR